MTAHPRVDPDRVRATLGDPELGWLVERLGSRVRHGRPLTGVVRLSPATAAQQRAAGRLLGRPGRGVSVSVPLAELEAELVDAGVAPDLQTAIEVLTGPLADLAAGRADDAARREAMLDAVGRGRHAGQEWYDTWQAALASDGTLTRLIGRGEEHVAGQAASVLGRLPADGLPLPVLAERVTGDTKALSGTPLAHLVLRALAQRAGRGVPSSGADRRALWEGAGVVLDDLASQVLVLGLTGRENHVVASWLRDAAGFGIPFRLTLHMLTQDPLTPAGAVLYVCENPAVLRVAAAELAGRCAALVCTEGEPSAACHRLLAAAAAAGAQVRWRGDLDWTGIRTTNTAIARYGAVPWRMSALDYREALALGDSEPLRGPPVDSGWDAGELSRELASSGRAVMEERLVPQLVEDLAPGGAG
jgi:uncharacterized protein (TIGR02679 family)